jgi:hypothetical protein
LRRAVSTTPSSPVPSRAKEDGSGTAGVTVELNVDVSLVMKKSKLPSAMLNCVDEAGTVVSPVSLMEELSAKPAKGSPNESVALLNSPVTAAMLTLGANCSKPAMKPSSLTKASTLPLNASAGPDPNWTVAEERSRVKRPEALLMWLVSPVPVMVMSWEVKGLGLSKELPVTV